MLLWLAVVVVGSMDLSVSEIRVTSAEVSGGDRDKQKGSSTVAGVYEPFGNRGALPLQQKEGDA